MYKKKINMMGIIKQLGDTLSASAFAEAGEYDTARQFVKTDQQLLLVITGTIGDYKSLKYAENFCDRMKAKLEVLCPAGMRESVEVSLASIRGKGIEYTLSEAEGCLKQSIVDITTGNQDIRYVVVNSHIDLESGCGKEANPLFDVTDIVKCPLVVVGV